MEDKTTNWIAKTFKGNILKEKRKEKHTVWNHNFQPMTLYKTHNLPQSAHDEKYELKSAFIIWFLSLSVILLCSPYYVYLINIAKIWILETYPLWQLAL